MKLKLKYLLPVTQIVFAIFLLHQQQLWIIQNRHQDMPSPGAAATVLALINSPIAVLRGIWSRSFHVFWPDWFFVLVLAVFWCWAGQEIESRLGRRGQATVARESFRIAADVLLTWCSVGLVFGSRYIDVRWFPWPYIVVSVMFFLFWTLVPLLLLVRDLLSIARRDRVSLLS
jgi:hypothetical protein